MLHEWHTNRTDYKLLTDKTNNLKAVNSVFTNTPQLIMKLVSFPAIKTAKSLNIVFVLNQNLLNSLSGDKVKKLQELDVKSILVSRKSTETKSALLLQIKEAGIKTYASHMNFERGKDELYVFNNEMKFIYGFYADVWDFKN